MANRIKLESIAEAHQPHQHDGADYSKNNFCPKCGLETVAYKTTDEYVCEACRHLVSADSVFCHHCGEELKSSDKIEHYFGGIKIDDALFKHIKTMKVE